MTNLYFGTVTIHVLAAVFWLGGILFLALVGAPILRAVEPPALRQELFRQLGTRFRVAGWIALGVLVATGLLNLHFRGLLDASVLGSARFWTEPYGRALAVKLGLVTVMLVLQAVHDFGVGPRASLLPAGSGAAVVLRKRAALLARVSALVGVGVVVAAVRLARGG